MKELEFDEIESITGGMKLSSMIGLFCGATLALACTVYLAPLAAATGAACAVGIYAMDYWKDNNLDYE